MRARILKADGIFLAAVGSLQVVLELLGHFTGRGVWGDAFGDSPYTIGFVEAHGLAALIGVLLLVVPSGDGRRHWHGFALAVHVLLGTANLVFWDFFVQFDLVPAGIGATVAHGLFVVAQAACLVSAPAGPASGAELRRPNRNTI